ncbi:glycosyltransferase family 2 protein [Desulfomicrobium baculatum]|uniref:Glycosyl transferase family 2 n=1 Tax=Desulfomicrobium baculatum (strain DSM 4028 / VKM B-1378 / X) TaxID=525897 RepID=C7LRZ1_DESBD|nr:glycosyltransferase [Desulfomicrobium baculatum]ACU89374.1 glycosyl transferase family 2 [Desulfomicrobium baculatum DSM 4028]
MLISVVIPSHKRPNLLDNCLDSIRESLSILGPRQACLVEVHVVFDGCFYPELEQKWRDVPRFYLWSIDKAGAAAARNYGAGKAQGDFIAFIDDDCIARFDWLPTILKEVGKLGGGTVALGGGVKAYPGKQTLAGSYLRNIAHLDGPICEGGVIVNMATANMLVRKKSFWSVGGFDQAFDVASEDENLCSRLRQVGDLTFSEHIIVFHHHDISLVKLIRKFFRYGYGVAQHANLVENDAREALSPYYPLWRAFRDIFSTFPVLLQRIRRTKEKFNNPYSAPLSCLAVVCELAFQAGVYKYNSNTRHK